MAKGIGRAGGSRRVLLGVLAAFGYGWVTAHIPSPEEPGTFWVSNLCAPFVLLPAAVVVLSRVRGVRAVLVGACISAAMVLGFYDVFAVPFVANASQSDLDPSTSPAVVALVAYERYFANFVLGVPGGIPWLTIAVLSGAVVGALALGRAGRCVVAAAPVLEGLAYLTAGRERGYPPSGVNLLIWSLEVVVGLGALVGVVLGPGRLRGRRQDLPVEEGTAGLPERTPR